MISENCNVLDKLIDAGSAVLVVAMFLWAFRFAVNKLADRFEQVLDELAKRQPSRED